MKIVAIKLLHKLITDSWSSVFCEQKLFLILPISIKTKLRSTNILSTFLLCDSSSNTKNSTKEVGQLVCIFHSKA